MNSIEGFDIYDINMILIMQSESPPQREYSLSKLVLDKIRLTINYGLAKLQKSRSFLGPSENIDVLFFGESNNNSLVFNSIIAYLTEIDYKLIKDNSDFPLIKSVYLSIPYLPDLYKKYLRATSFERNIIKANTLSILFSYGKFILARQMLEKYRPKILFMSNDHSPFNRCLLHHSKSMGIKTIYMQHASVSNKFPLLRFDYSFLDGRESFEKYKETSKNNSKVILSGSSRFDNFRKTNLNNNRYKVGISINQYDDFEIVKKLCLSLRKAVENCELVVRPHPNMIDWNRGWFNNEQIEYSDSAVEPSYEFLKSLKIQISNVSGIHLDAAMLKVPTVLYQLSKECIDDQYGYIVNGLIKQASNFDELLNYIEFPKVLIPKAEIVQYYVASIGTCVEGRVGEFTASYISSILRKEEDEFENNCDLKIYRF